MTLPDAIRSGRWLTPERLRAYPAIVAILAAVVLAGLVATSEGLVRADGQPVGTDFSNVYAAGRLVLDGRTAAPYDPALQHAAERAVFGGRDVAFYGWHYPPMALLPAAALALLPYGLALVAWMAATLALYLAVVRAIVPRPETLVVALGFPAVFVNLGHGQNGFLTAALLGGALLVLDRRPWLAGLLIGLLAYKPQFGMLIPLVLAATGRWRTFAAATATVAASAALTLVLFGAGVWEAFATSTRFTLTVVLEAGATGFEKIQSLYAALRVWESLAICEWANERFPDAGLWPEDPMQRARARAVSAEMATGFEKIQSLYAALRAWGVQSDAAFLAQALLGLAVAVAVTRLWRSPAAFDLKAAGLAVASLLATPYVLDYDMVVLAIAIAFFVRHGLHHGFRADEASILALAWTVPLVARTFGGATGIPLGLLAMLALGLLVLRRAAADRARPAGSGLAHA